VNRLKKAGDIVRVGGRYRHVKSGGLYRLKELAILENSEEIGVMYQAEYGKKLTWVRTLADFTAIVEINGKKTPRFMEEKEEK
jgi:hypothetical protein